MEFEGVVVVVVVVVCCVVAEDFVGLVAAVWSGAEGVGDWGGAAVGAGSGGGGGD